MASENIVQNEQFIELVNKFLAIKLVYNMVLNYFFIFIYCYSSTCVLFRMTLYELLFLGTFLAFMHFTLYPLCFSDCSVLSPNLFLSFEILHNFKSPPWMLSHHYNVYFLLVSNFKQSLQRPFPAYVVLR